MAMTFEKVPEKDWALFNSFQLKYEKEDVIASKHKCWVVDRERDIFFILLGGGTYDRPEEYALILNNKVIILDTTCRRVKGVDGNKILHWRIESVVVPSELKKKEKDILNILYELICVYSNCNFEIDYVSKPKYIGNNKGE